MRWMIVRDQHFEMQVGPAPAQVEGLSLGHQMLENDLLSAGQSIGLAN